MAFKKFLYLVFALSLSGCGIVSAVTEEQPKQNLVLLPAGSPAATVIHRNPSNTTITLVTFQECETKAFARPEPQVIEPGSSATYQIAPGCYETWSGTNTKFVSRKYIRPEAGQTIQVP